MNSNKLMRLVALLLIFLTVVVFLVWNAGVLPLPFLPSPLPEPPESEPSSSESSPADPGSESESTDPQDSESGDSSQSESSSENPGPGASFPNASDLIAGGARPMTDFYDPATMIIGRTALSESFSMLSPAFGTYDLETVIRKETQTSGIALQTKTEQRTRLSLTPYMGYILAYTESATYLLSSDGTVLRDNFPSVTLVFDRDSQNRPIVLYEGTYYAIKANGALASISYTPASHGVFADTPEAAIRSDLEPYSARVPSFTLVDPEDVTGTQTLYTETQKTAILSGVSPENALIQFPASPDSTEARYTLRYQVRWGYRNKSGQTVIQPIYLYAFPFGENGLAAVTTYNERVRAETLMFINTSGRIVIDVAGKRYDDYTVNDADVYDGYYLSLTKNETAIGSYIFDQGFVRVRRRIVLRTKITHAYTDEDILISETGDIFALPEGYTLISYSDGLLLLEKNGAYGYMDNRGNWIAQPVYSSAAPFYCGLAVVEQNGAFGVIDTNGDFVLPPIYSAISHASQGVFSACHPDEGWALYQILLPA